MLNPKTWDGFGESLSYINRTLFPTHNLRHKASLSHWREKVVFATPQTPDPWFYLHSPVSSCWFSPTTSDVAVYPSLNSAAEAENRGGEGATERGERDGEGDRKLSRANVEAATQQTASNKPRRLKMPPIFHFGSSPNTPVSTLFIFFHGNSSTVNHALELYQTLGNVCGAVVVALEYPGYADGERRCRATSLIRRMKLAVEYVWDLLLLPEQDKGKETERRAMMQSRTFLIGHSLGCAVALKLAADHFPRLAGLVLFSPFTSIKEMIDHALSGGTLSKLTQAVSQERFDNVRAVEATKCPICIIAGTNDPVTPFRMSSSLFALAAMNKDRLVQLIVRDDAGHHIPTGPHLAQLLPSLLAFLTNAILFPGVPKRKLVQRHALDTGVDFKTYWTPALLTWMGGFLKSYQETIKERFKEAFRHENENENENENARSSPPLFGTSGEVLVKLARVASKSEKGKGVAHATASAQALVLGSEAELHQAMLEDIHTDWWVSALQVGFSVLGVLVVFGLVFLISYLVHFRKARQECEREQQDTVLQRRGRIRGQRRDKDKDKDNSKNKSKDI